MSRKAGEFYTKPNKFSGGHQVSGITSAQFSGNRPSTVGDARQQYNSDITYVKSGRNAPFVHKGAESLQQKESFGAIPPVNNNWVAESSAKQSQQLDKVSYESAEKDRIKRTDTDRQI